MSDADVYPNEMNDPHDLEDATADALLSGDRHTVPPQLTDFVGDVRIAYTSTPAVSAEIAALMGVTPPVPAPSFVSRRFARMRSTMLAKIGAATTVVVAATGGLAAAHALPAPVQDAVSHLGVGAPSHHSLETPSAEDSTTTVDPTVTTMPNDTTPTTAENHGGEVSAIAHDHSADECNHGAVVSNVASDGKSQDDSQEASDTDEQSGACETTTTVDGTTPSTDNHDGDDQGDNHDGTPPTTVAGGTTPTSEHRDGGGHDGSSNGGDNNSSGSDHGGGSRSGGGSGSGGGN